MKKMMTALTALFLLTGTTAFAQNTKPEKPADAPQPVQRPTVEQLARSRTERMAERLQLTEEQSQKVYAATLEQLRSAEALREKARAAKLAEAETMKQVLTTEQFMRWSQMQCRRGVCNRGPQCGMPCNMPKRPCPQDGTPKSDVKRFKAGKASGMRQGQGRRGAPVFPAPEAPQAPAGK